MLGAAGMQSAKRGTKPQSCVTNKGNTFSVGFAFKLGAKFGTMGIRAIKCTAQGLEGLLGDAGAGATGRVAADGAGRIALAAARSQSCLPPLGGNGASRIGASGGGSSSSGGSRSSFSGASTGLYGGNGGGMAVLAHAPTA